MFATVQENSIEEKIYSKEDLPSLYDLLERYRNHLRVQRAVTTSISHTVFAAYQGESPEEEPSSATDLKKASITGITPRTPKPCLCGGKHLFKECFYLMEHLRKPNWSPKAETEKQIKARLKGNERLKGIIDQI